MSMFTDICSDLNNHPAFVQVGESQDICFHTMERSYTYINKDLLVFYIWVEAYRTDELLITVSYEDYLEGTESVKLDDHNSLKNVINTIADMCDI